MKAENEYIKNLSALITSEKQKKQKAEIVTQLRQKYPLEILLKISKVKRSTYYYNEKKG